ncbi:hypothetical protein HDU67_010066 [Dinochytrium kinnereticum]|nr:hypothetical protein HDU67_010066 [Dinochytrium kinnereticum]
MTKNRKNKSKKKNGDAVGNRSPSSTSSGTTPTSDPSTSPTVGASVVPNDLPPPQKIQMGMPSKSTPVALVSPVSASGTSVASSSPSSSGKSAQPVVAATEAAIMRRRSMNPSNGGAAEQEVSDVPESVVKAQGTEETKPLSERNQEEIKDSNPAGVSPLESRQDSKYAEMEDLSPSVTVTERDGESKSAAPPSPEVASKKEQDDAHEKTLQAISQESTLISMESLPSQSSDESELGTVKETKQAEVKEEHVAETNPEEWTMATETPLPSQLDNDAIIETQQASQFAAAAATHDIIAVAKTFVDVASDLTAGSPSKISAAAPSEQRGPDSMMWSLTRSAVHMAGPALSLFHGAILRPTSRMVSRLPKSMQTVLKGAALAAMSPAIIFLLAISWPLVIAYRLGPSTFKMRLRDALGAVVGEVKSVIADPAPPIALGRRDEQNGLILEKPGAGIAEEWREEMRVVLDVKDVDELCKVESMQISVLEEVVPPAAEPEVQMTPLEC